jgi:predicted Fe-Mo cluster-binding NifX family protein
MDLRRSARRGPRRTFHALPARRHPHRREGTVRIAFAAWQDRIAPVFDVARRVVLVEGGPDRPIRREDMALEGAETATRVRALTERKVEVLICGAISRAAQEVVETAGIRTVAFVAGRLDEIEAAWWEGRLAGGRYAMPGCRGGGRLRRRRRGNGTCFCPDCGHEESHVRGVPCVERSCPHCGRTLSRR